MQIFHTVQNICKDYLLFIMKKVALFVHNFSVEYSLSVAQGVASFFTPDKDMQLILAQTNQPNYPYGLYEYQYWTSAELLKADDIDLIIIITSAYQTYITPENLKEYIEPYTNKPIVSVSVDLPFENVHATVSDCEAAYDQVVDHLIKVHGCHNIAFLSATKTTSSEAGIRLEAYKKALKNHNLEFKQENVIEGYFMKEAAHNVMLEQFKSKKDITFDALISANDLMAEGGLVALKELGLKVPKDIKVVGFDDTARAAFLTPSLSTINQNITEHGKAAAEIAYKILNGQEVERITKIKSEPIYRQSCGCVKNSASFLITRGQDGAIRQNQHLKSSSLEEYTEYFKDITGINTLVDTFHVTHTLKELLNSLPEISIQLQFLSMAIVFYEEPIYFKKNDKITIPDKAYLKTYISNRKQIIPYDEKGIELNPHKSLIPYNYVSPMPGSYILYPIFAGEKQYGYLIVETTNTKFHMHHIYLKLIVNAIASAYDFNQTISKNEALESRNERLLKNNQELNFQNSIDELTQVLNRRGFMDKAEKELRKASKNGKSGMVFFADMDGLKKINDTYGHKIGDIAIQTEAKVLEEAFRDSDIVGRLSGDEFAIVSTGLTSGYVSAIKARIEQLNKIFSEDAKLPLTLSMSIGAVAFNPGNTNLDELLSKADQQLYKEKEIKHSSS